MKQTVLDSNVLVPGSTWQLRVESRDEGGSTVTMTLHRHFRRSVAGVFGAVINRVLGSRGWGYYLGTALKAVEHAQARRQSANSQVSGARPLAG